MKKLYTSKIFLKMAGGKMHTPYFTPRNPPLTVSNRDHQKSLTYFSYLAPLVLFFFTNRHSQRGAWQYLPPKYAPGELPRTCLSD